MPGRILDTRRQRHYELALSRVQRAQAQLTHRRRILLKAHGKKKESFAIRQKLLPGASKIAARRVGRADHRDFSALGRDANDARRRKRTKEDRAVAIPSPDGLKSRYRLAQILG